MRFALYLSLCVSFFLTTAANAMAAPAAPEDFRLVPEESTPTTTAIHQYGITWTFAEPVQFGQFVNGDYWVVDPGSGVKVVAISPGHTVVESRAMHGSMVNPPYHGQGYDSALAAYDQDLNVGIGISASTPLVISGGATLVSSISNLDIPGHTSRVRVAAVLACLSSSPLSGSFRPGYSDPDKTIHNAGSLDYSLLAKLTPPSSVPSLASVENMFQRVWLDHIAGWTARYLHPTENMPGGNYGREISRDVGIGALMLHLNFPDSEKEKLLISYIQLGIDLYGIVKAGGKSNWPPDGGHASGRKWPILFAGIMLDDADMKAIGGKSGDYLYANGYGPGNVPPDYVHFGEDGQTFYVQQFDVDITNGPNWNPDTRNPNGCDPYTLAMIDMPEWAIRHSSAPNVSDASWTAEYRQCCAPNAWTGFVLAARIMGAEALWNNPALFDFQDRYMAITAGQQDPVYTVPDEEAGWRSLNTFTTDMWDNYRASY